MSGKTAVNVVSGHLLLWAGIAPAGLAERALAAGQDCGNHDVVAEEVNEVVPGGRHLSRDLVPEHEGQGMFGPHGSVGEGQVGVAESAGQHFDERFLRARTGQFVFTFGERLTGCVQKVGFRFHGFTFFATFVCGGETRPKARRRWPPRAGKTHAS